MPLGSLRYRQGDLLGAEWLGSGGLDPGPDCDQPGQFGPGIGVERDGLVEILGLTDAGDDVLNPQGSIIPTGRRCCKEKETIWKEPNLGIFFANERAQTAGALGGIDQSAIRADLEDETVGKGRGRGTNACTQCNDERKRAVSRP